MRTIAQYLTTLSGGALLSFTVYTQQPIQTTLGSINRQCPKIGFNTNGQMPANTPTNSGNLGANWTQQDFIDSAASLNAQILRFPGGTNANHWDWQTGWFLPAYQPPFPPIMVRPEEFQLGLNAMNQTEGLYVMNLETSTVSYEMDGLRHMNDLGLNPSMIELGNEHNLPNNNFPLQFFTSQTYAQMAKIYYDSVKAINPGAKVCVVGSNTNQRTDWHTQILAQNPSIEAFAWHAYTNANNTDLVFNVDRSFAEAFADANHPGSLEYRYITGGFNTLPPDKEIWVTEYNLWETQISSVPVIGGSWTHSLYLTAMHNCFLSKSNVSMFLNHSLASVDPWHEAISKLDHHITASGVAMKLLLDVSKGAQTVQDMTFSGNQSITYGTTTFPKLVGWKFNHLTDEKGFICNFSKDTLVVSLNQIFFNPIDFISYWADTNFIVNGISSLNQLQGNTDSLLTIYPYAFVQLSSSPPNTQPSISTLSATNLCQNEVLSVSGTNFLTVTSVSIGSNNLPFTILSDSNMDILCNSSISGLLNIVNASGFVSSNQNISIIGLPQTNTITDEISIIAVNTNATYQWINCSDSSSIQGENNLSYQPQISGDYAVIITENGCSDTSSCTSITLANASIYEFETKELGFYPNPVDKTLYFTDTLVEVLITNHLGQLIYCEKKPSGMLDTSLFESGVYLLQTGPSRHKFIVKHEE